jgi:hypothetical protein
VSGRPSGVARRGRLVFVGVVVAGTLASISAAAPTGMARAAAPTLGAWEPDGPTRTIMDAVTPVGARATALLAQSPDGIRRSADGGLTWTEPAGLPPPPGDGGVSSATLAVLATDRDRAWIAMAATQVGSAFDASGGAAAAGGGAAQGGGAAEAGGGATDPGDGAAPPDDPDGNEVAGPALLASVDAGASWTPVPGDGLAGRIVIDLAAVPAAAGEIVLLAADATVGILRSEDGGRTFGPGMRGIEPDPEIGGIMVGGLAAGTAPGQAFASTTNGIWRTADGGLTWVAACVTSAALPCGRPAVAAGDPSLILGAGFGGVVRSADGGRTWARTGSATLPGPEDGGIDFVTLSTDPEPVVWASGSRGVFRSADGGVSWEPWNGDLGAPGASASDRIAIDPASRARGWRIHGLAFFATTDGGRTWSELPGPDPAGVPAYAALARDGTRVVGTDGGIVVRSDRGWMTTRAGAVATDLAWGPLVDDVYAATYGAGVLRSGDGGVTWIDWSRGLPGVPAWTILGPATAGGRALLASDAGAFERSVDAPSWARLGIGLPDAAVRSLAIAPDGAVLAGLETRGVWRLARGLDEWRPVGLEGRTVLSVAVASADGRVLLAATDRRGLWRSADAGRTWRRITSTRATASVAWDPTTGVAVLATGPGVLSSADAGRTWRPLRAGLPALDPLRPWARSTTAVRPLAEGGFALTTLGGTYLARPGVER